MAPSADPVRFDRDHFEAIPMAAFATNPKGVVVAWNSMAADLLGVQAVEACGVRCADLLEGQTAGGEPVCSAACPLVLQLSQWMGSLSPGGRRDWRPPDTRTPRAHPDLVVRRADGTRLSLAVLGLAALLDGDPVLVHLMTAR